jgi:hypothetical protein
VSFFLSNTTEAVQIRNKKIRCRVYWDFVMRTFGTLCMHARSWRTRLGW